MYQAIWCLRRFGVSDDSTLGRNPSLSNVVAPRLAFVYAIQDLGLKPKAIKWRRSATTGVTGDSVYRAIECIGRLGVLGDSTLGRNLSLSNVVAPRLAFVYAIQDLGLKPKAIKWRRSATTDVTGDSVYQAIWCLRRFGVSGDLVSQAIWCNGRFATTNSTTCNPVKGVRSRY